MLRSSPQNQTSSLLTFVCFHSANRLRAVRPSPSLSRMVSFSMPRDVPVTLRPTVNSNSMDHLRPVTSSPLAGACAVMALWLWVNRLCSTTACPVPLTTSTINPRVPSVSKSSSTPSLAKPLAPLPARPLLSSPLPVRRPTPRSLPLQAPPAARAVLQ